MRETLRALVDRDVAVNPEMAGRLVRVLVAGVDIKVAAGVADRATGAPGTSDSTVTASMQVRAARRRL